MAFPVTFATLTSPASTALFDQQFAAVANGMEIACTASGANAIALTPITNQPSLNAYTELNAFRFRAAAQSSAPVSASFNGIGFLNVYHADGVTQAGAADLLLGQLYLLTYSASLNTGAGGFFLQSLGAPVSTNTTFVPGGRLTFQSATPVMTSNQLAQQTIFYAPYNHQFVPIYNGSTINMVDFCASLSDQVGLSLALGGSANWPTGNNFDVFVTLVGGVPTLCTVQWTNNTTRATTLAIFGGFQTNSVSVTARTSASTTITLGANQGTFLGTFQTSANGQSQWQFGGAASGGSAANLFLSNYYNPVLFVSTVTDSGAPYTYTSGTIREARASTGNQQNIVCCSSERAILVKDDQQISNANAANAVGFAGVGINSTTVMSDRYFNQGANNNFRIPSVVSFSFTGLLFVAALEGSDAANANQFNSGQDHQLTVMVWL